MMPLEVSVPKYNRDNIKTSIAHIGIGNFHRSHQAYYTHELMDKYNQLNCGICGIDILESDRKIYNILKDQDGLYSLVTKHPTGIDKVKIIGSIVEYFFAPENPLAAIEKLASPEIHVISLTIAEDGYHLDEITGEFDINNTIIEEDSKNPFAPTTVFGYLTQAFLLRKQRNINGCTILSCDNIQSNGDTIKNSLYNYIKKVIPDLLPWVEENVTFPNTMVDRITTETVTKDIERLKQYFQLDDQWPVVCAPFVQWVIEDKFANKRPEWEKVGAQFVENIESYEQMKLRLFNAGHSILGIFGTLLGYKYVGEAANDEHIIKFINDYLHLEAKPVLKSTDEANINQYIDKLIARYQNTNIKDSLSRICKESSSKIPLFVLPTIYDQLNQSKNIKRASFLIAAWCKYNDGVDINGNYYQINDTLSNILIRTAALSQESPIRFLEIEPVFKQLIDDHSFVEYYLKSYDKLKNYTIIDCLKEIDQI